MEIKWDTLKSKAIAIAVGNKEYVEIWKAGPYALLAGVGDGTFDWRKNAIEMRKEVIRIIERWDVRRAKALIDLFPGIVPKRCWGRVPVCFIADTEKAHWMVGFPEGSQG